MEEWQQDLSGGIAQAQALSQAWKRKRHLACVSCVRGQPQGSVSSGPDRSLLYFSGYVLYNRGNQLILQSFSCVGTLVTSIERMCSSPSHYTSQ